MTNGFSLSLAAGIIALITGAVLIWGYHHINEAIGEPKDRSSEELVTSYIEGRLSNPPDEESSQILLDLAVLADRAESWARTSAEVVFWPSLSFFGVAALCFLSAYYQRPPRKNREST